MIVPCKGKLTRFQEFARVERLSSWIQVAPLLLLTREVNELTVVPKVANQRQ